LWLCACIFNDLKVEIMIQDLIKQAYLDGYAKGEKCDWVKPQSAKESMASDYAEKQVKNIAYEPVLANCNATLDRCECEEPKEEPIKICLNCNGYIE
jgi:hypothetical protein